MPAGGVAMKKYNLSAPLGKLKVKTRDAESNKDDFLFTRNFYIFRAT